MCKVLIMALQRCYSTLKREFSPNSKIKIFRKKAITLSHSKSGPKEKHGSAEESKRDLTLKIEEPTNKNVEYAENIVKVQMISKNLHEQIFPKAPREASPNRTAATQKYKNELYRHGIDIDKTIPEHMEDVILNLPPLQGNDIEEHFFSIAKEQVAPYEKLLQPLVQCSTLPQRPAVWRFQDGWTVYDPQTGHSSSIDYPLEDGLVLDVEVCVREGPTPLIATAVGTKNWYSWVSPKLTCSKEKNFTSTNQKDTTQQHYTTDDLIPFGMHGPRIIVGHNVSYDRARLREQYLLEDTKIRFIDTMSLHVCISGITSYQRAMLKSKKEPAEEDLEWLEQSSLNSLAEVYKLYCGGKELSKEQREIFIVGSINDVRDNFQMLMNYCADDVAATHDVLRVVYPLYLERFPHPVTLAGMLELGSAYLPVNTNWLRYIKESCLTYEDLSIEGKYHLSQRADEACALLNDAKYRQNIWLWDEDWSVQELKLKKASSSTKKSRNLKSSCQSNNNNMHELSEEEKRLQSKFQYLYDMKELLPVRRPLLPGYPAWYRKLCLKPPFYSSKTKKMSAESYKWVPGASEISTSMQIAPKLLSLCWEGYPLHYIREYGWGFLVPFRTEYSHLANIRDNCGVPIEQLMEFCPVPEFIQNCASESESEMALSNLYGELEAKLGKREFYSKIKKKDSDESNRYKGSGIWCKHVVDECCHFLKLPHKNGPSFRVGNPLSKDFLNKFSENVLGSGDSSQDSASRVIEIARMMSYWRNNRDRIMSQLVIWLPLDSSKANDSMRYGAICPQVVVSGTLTRRAMEPTWLTASNSNRERIGSELRAMVQAPPSYKIVGADVDSQELWIAAVLGDADACGMHGATPFGWMTLSGSKANGTDLHSVTAKAVGISRDHAKVINYARIYGAGQSFAESLVKQFNPTFSASEAKTKAMKMFAITKGKRVYRLQSKYLQDYEDKIYSGYEALKVASSCNLAVSEMFEKPHWTGGTESAMFNRLEKIAMEDAPVTPFLGGRLSRALESNANNENRFLPTRVNWVVQSGAVDFLHLMLVSMRWLMGQRVRFCLSFHDEIRYLVKEEMAYKTALAMHITNLLTRSFCASRVGLTDLPMSVAFFSSVEVDTVLRKECTMDCKTPSNPLGLKKGYGIPPGESLNIYQAISKAKCNDV